MHNLTPSNKSSIEFYREVVNSKRNSPQDPDYKARLAANFENIPDLFEDYDRNFADDLLVTRACHGFNHQDKADLLKLYSFQNSLIQSLKIAVTTNEHGRIINTCQNCTINEISSFDHLLPKNEFSEFSVHPKNLFPSCSKCNEHKGQTWREGVNNLFLNLYLDDLPEEQFLFVDVIIDENVIEADFRLSNIYGISEDMFRLLSSHYERLHLCKRFKENSDSVIVVLQNVLRTSLGLIEIEDAVELAIETSERNQTYFGHNYWKSILELALLRNERFIEQVLA